MKSGQAEVSAASKENSRGWRARGASLLRRMVTHRRLPLMLAGISVVLTLPSLGAGWIADDYLQRTRMADADFFPGISGRPWRFFDFGTHETMAWAMDIGVWPWWTYPDICAAFWRPLTVATHWVDYQLWPEQPILMHAHSIAWLGLLAACVAVLYRHLVSHAWVAGLAALFYAIDDARAMPVGFLANRNAIVASVFGVLAIVFHDGWRRKKSLVGAWLSPLCLLAALLSAEAGVGAVAYLVAYCVFLDRATIRRRVASLAPSVLVVLGWRIVWSSFGYGVNGVGLYVDPLREPIRFVTDALVRAPLLLVGQLALPPSYLYLPAVDFGSLGTLVAWAVIVLSVLGWALTPLIRASRTARFWALGMVLALAPICATFPADRLLFFVGLGAFGLLAAFLHGIASDAPWSAARLEPGWRLRGVRFVVFAMVIIHGAIAPLGLAVRSGMPVGPAFLLEAFQVHEPMGDEVAQQSVIIVNAPVPLLAGHLPFRRAFDGQAVPKHTRVLAPHDDPIGIFRSDERTIIVRPRRGFLYSAFDRLARHDACPFSVGERVVLSDMTAEILELTNEGRPADVRFRFRESLESDAYRWFYWTGRTFKPFALPEVGDMVILPQPGRTTASAHADRSAPTVRSH